MMILMMVSTVDVIYIISVPILRSHHINSKIFLPHDDLD